ncbi:zinc ribbon-containing protein [Marinomonas epiphytica]
MKTMKKVSSKRSTDKDLLDEAKKTLVGAKDWLLEDVALMGAYWHDKMGYMEAWVDANWHLVLEGGEEWLDELDDKEDQALLWLINHANNNPVPLENCHTVGELVEQGEYHCLSCGYEMTLNEPQDLPACAVCHFGILSSHDLADNSAAY